MATEQIVRRRDPRDPIGDLREGARPPPPVNEPPDFSLVLGGPLCRLWCRMYLSGAVLQFLRRRVLVLTALAWVPLLILSILEGHAWGTRVALPFLYDIEIHVRLLLAIPLLIVAELAVHQRMRPVVMQFLE